jgi:hypothetical protein
MFFCSGWTAAMESRADLWQEAARGFGVHVTHVDISCRANDVARHKIHLLDVGEGLSRY